MSVLTSELLRDILAEIFFAPEVREANKRFIVPKQGNWYNPQDTSEGKPATWVAYAITSRVTQLKAREDVELDEDETYERVVSLLTELVYIDLQFVGASAEAFAVSVMHWPKRADVTVAFDIVSGQVRDDKIKVVASWFTQEGLNTTYAYNVQVRVYCENTMSGTAQVLKHVTADGSID